MASKHHFLCLAPIDGSGRSFNLLATNQFLKNSSKILQKSSRMSPKILKNDPKLNSPFPSISAAGLLGPYLVLLQIVIFLQFCSKHYIDHCSVLQFPSEFPTTMSTTTWTSKKDTTTSPDTSTASSLPKAWITRVLNQNMLKVR